jgi:hypothetical protein
MVPLHLVGEREEVVEGEVVAGAAGDGPEAVAGDDAAALELRLPGYKKTGTNTPATGLLSGND